MTWVDKGRSCVYDLLLTTVETVHINKLFFSQEYINSRINAQLHVHNNTDIFGRCFPLYRNYQLDIMVGQCLQDMPFSTKLQWKLCTYFLSVRDAL